MASVMSLDSVALPGGSEKVYMLRHYNNPEGICANRKTSLIPTFCVMRMRDETMPGCAIALLAAALSCFLYRSVLLEQREQL